MLRLLLVLIVVAGVAGFFTRPNEAAMRQAADAVLDDPQDLTEGLESLGATLAGERAYDNYFVLARYTVELDNEPLVQCWGAFTQVSCNRVEGTAAS